MIELFLGVGLGAMAFTQTGRELGNKAFAVAVDLGKKAVERGKESAEQSARAAGHDSHNR